MRPMDPRKTMPPRSARRWLSLLALLGVVARLPSACQSAEATGGGTVCTYLQTIDCTGVEGCVGARTCLPDLSGFGPCQCGDAGTDAAAASDAGQRADR